MSSEIVLRDIMRTLMPKIEKLISKHFTAEEIADFKTWSVEEMDLHTMYLRLELAEIILAKKAKIKQLNMLFLENPNLLASEIAGEVIICYQKSLKKSKKSKKISNRYQK